MSVIKEQLATLFSQDVEVVNNDIYQVILPYRYSFHERDQIREHFLGVMGDLKNEDKFYVLVSHTCVHYPEASEGKEFQLIYIFLNPEAHCRLIVKVNVSQKESIISLRSLWPSIKTMEEEVHQDFGVKYFVARGAVNLQDEAATPYMRKERRIDELERTNNVSSFPKFQMPLKPTLEESGLKWRRFGPFSEELAGPDRLDVLFNEEEDYVHTCHLHSGLYKRFIEKKSEKQDIHHLGLVMMRLSSSHSLFYSLLLTEAVEKMAAIYVPLRAQALRMMLCEMGRIRSHLTSMNACLSVLGFDFEAQLVRRILSQAYDIDKMYSERQKNYSPFTIGGVISDIPNGWMTEFLSFGKELTRTLEQIKFYIFRNPDMIRLTNRSSIEPSQALELGLVGPVLRSCGVNYDLRKHSPSYLYGDVDFETPLGIAGTNYDRFLVRVEETFQSLSIIQQLLNSLPRGDIYNRDHAFHRAYLRPLKKDIHSKSFYNEMDTLLPRGEIHHYLEGPEGEIGLYFVSQGEGYPYRLHFKSPSLCHSQAYPLLTSRDSIENCFISLKSMNIDSWEIDR